MSIIESNSLSLGADAATFTSLEPVWKYVLGDYELLEKLGKGSYGLVVKAKHRETGKLCAIKHIKDVFYNEYEAHKVLREVHIMRKLSTMKTNIFTSKLVDVIVPFRDQENSLSQKESQLLFEEIFLVQEFFHSDMSNIIKEASTLQMTEEHIKTIIYNVLCAVNFIHSAQLIHRDLKPANILINSQCNVRICDFGLARSLPSEFNPPQTNEDAVCIDNTDIDCQI